jgi:hypothetical protein
MIRPRVNPPDDSPGRISSSQSVFIVSGSAGTTCHCEARSVEANTRLTSRRRFVRQEIASALRTSQ